MLVLMCKYPPLVVVVVVVVVEVGQTGSQLIQSRLDWRRLEEQLAEPGLAAGGSQQAAHHPIINHPSPDWPRVRSLGNTQPALTASKCSRHFTSDFSFEIKRGSVSNFPSRIRSYLTFNMKLYSSVQCSGHWTL